MNKPWEIDWDAPWMQPWGARDTPSLPEPGMPDDPNTAFGFNSIQESTPERIEPPAGHANTQPDENGLLPLTEYADEAKAERGFGRSAYMNGLTGDLPDLSATRQPLNIPATPDAANASRETDPFEGEEFSELARRRGQQFARGATEVVASVPEALAIINASGERSISKDASGYINAAVEQITAIDQRLAEFPDMNAEDRERLADVRRQSELTIRNYGPLAVGSDLWQKIQPAFDRDLFAAGDELRAESAEMFGTPDPRDQSFWAQVAEGGGNMTAMAAAALLAGPVAGAATGASMNSQSLYKEARQAGADEETALYASKWGSLIGASEIIPINRALQLLPPRLREEVGGRVYKRLADVIQSSGEEAGQEYLATIANNIVADKLYDPGRGWTEGATEAALVGAVLGGGMGATGTAIDAAVGPKDGSPPQGDPDPERINSPRLTPEDRQSPIPNAIIDDGKAIIDNLISGTSPAQPNAGIAPLADAKPYVLTPRDDTARQVADGFNAIGPAMPEAPAAPIQPAPAPVPAAPLQLSESQRATPETPAAPVDPAAAAPVNPDPERYEDLPEIEDGEETGRTIRVDMETGSVQVVDIRAAGSVLPVGLAPSVDTEGDFSPQDAPPAKPRRETLQKRPLTNLLKAVGVKPGSPLARELNARGINNTTHPGLFRWDGHTDWDNLPAREWTEYAAVVGEDGQGYLSRDGLIQELENEMRGDPTRVGEQERLALAREAKLESERFADLPVISEPIEAGDQSWEIPVRDVDISTDAERLDTINKAIASMEDVAGISDVLTPEERSQIVEALDQNGGDVENALWASIRRSAELAETQSEAEFAEFSNIPLFDGETGRGSTAVEASSGAQESERGQAASAGSQPRVEASARADVGPTQSEQTAVGEQALIPGVEPVSQKQRLEAQMQAPKQGGDDAPPAGRGDLFGDPDQRGDLFDAPPAATPAIPAASETDLARAKNRWASRTTAERNRELKQGDPSLSGSERLSIAKGNWADIPESARNAFAAAMPELKGDGTSAAPIEVEAKEDVDTAAAVSEAAPTDAQKEAGNYKKGHIKWNGLDVSIENAKGSERSGKDGSGKAWSVTMPAHYGYVRRTEGADGDHVDVYIGDNPESDFVAIVDQVDPDTGKFDEHKVVLGTKNQAAAEKLYQAGFSDGRGKARMGGVTTMTADKFKAWLADGDTTKPLSAAPAVEAKPYPEGDEGSDGRVEMFQKQPILKKRMSANQWDMFQAVQDNPGVSTADLADQIGVAEKSVPVMINRINDAIENSGLQITWGYRSAEGDKPANLSGSKEKIWDAASASPGMPAPELANMVGLTPGSVRVMVSGINKKSPGAISQGYVLRPTGEAFQKPPVAHFFSPLFRAVEGAKQKSATARDWKAIIGKMPGVKRAEVEWVGVEEWLDMQEGQVSKEALLEFLRESQIEVVENELSDQAAARIEVDYSNEKERGVFAADIVFGNDSYGPSGLYLSDEDLYQFDELGGTGTEADVLADFAREADVLADFASEARHEAYTEPGGENYREILLRMPMLHNQGKNKAFPFAVQQELDSLTDEMDEIRSTLQNPDAAGAFHELSAEDQARYRAAQDRGYKLRDQRILSQTKEPFVQSGHFEQENIVVHARVKDRTGPNREKILFVEEIQSDLASRHREATESPEVTARRRDLGVRAEEARARAADVRNLYYDMLAEAAGGNTAVRSDLAMSGLTQEIANAPPSATDRVEGVSFKFNDPEGIHIAAKDMLQAASYARQAESDLLALGTEKTMDPSLPDTPFKEENTYALMVKRLLRMAAEDGYDKLAWTPGYMQAERWDAAAQNVVDSVKWEDAPAATGAAKRVVLGLQGSEDVALVSEAGVVSGAAPVDGKPLSSLLGPSLAKQIMDEASGEVSGQKITFPDSGYAIAYDQQIKRSVDKLAKKHGARVAVDKTLPDFEAPNQFYGDTDPRPVWSIEITDDLREAAMQPMPILQKGGAKVDQAKIDDMMPDLRAQLDSMALKRVHLFHDPNLQDAQATFTSSKKANLMMIVIGAALDPAASLRHEAIHALKAMDLFTDSEWATLSERADQEWIKKYDIEERYGELSRDQQIEEAIAEAFGEAGTIKPSGAIRAAFAKMKRFFKALGNVLTGRDIKSIEDIFTDVAEGRVGARDAEMDPDGEFAMFQKHPPASYLPQRHVYNSLQQTNASRFSRIKNWSADKFDAARIALQDRYLPIMRAVQSVEKQTGTQLPDAMNPYMTEEQMSGKVGRDLDDIEELYVQPIIALLAKTKKDLTIENVGHWLNARHAKERNARISQINPKYKPGEGSGLTDAEAQVVLDEFENSPHKDTLDAIADMVDDLRERTIQTKVDAGLLSQSDANALRSMYQFYVPLRGFAETDNADATLDVQGIGRRLNVKGAESKRAAGRSSLSFNPLVGAITQAQEAAIRAGKNRVGNAMYELVTANPSPDWSTVAVKQKRYFNKSTGMVETRSVSAENTQLEPDEFATKVNGQEYRIKINDPRLAQALGNVGSQQFGAITTGLMKFSRYFSATNTMLNPEFMITNALRDFTTAQINIQGFGKDQKAKLAKAMAKNWRKAFKGAWKAMGDAKSNDPWAKKFREYEEAGGKVSFWQIDDPNKSSSDLRKRIKRASSLKGKASSVLLFSTRDNPILRQIERVNLAIDNAIRLAAFTEAKNLGWSDQKAASLAKNLTVNFNRRGEASPVLNGLYPFFNAAIQGTHILATALKYKRPRRIVAALVAYGVMEDMVNAWLSEEDEDGELAWDKVADWKLRRNILINADGNDPWTIPLPYGYNVFPYAGKQISKVARGVKDPGESLAHVLATVIESVSPISGQSVWEAVTPTIVKPGIEIAVNREFFLDRPIAPHKWPTDAGLPDAYNAYRGTPEFWKEVSNIMNRATGGNSLEPGAVDVSPDVLEHLFGFGTGGAGRFVDRMVNLGTMIALGDIQGIEANDIPFVRQTSYTTGPWLDQTRYYDFREGVQAALNRESTSEETGESLSPADRALTTLKPAMRSADKRLKLLRKKKYPLYEDRTLPLADRNARIDEIRESELEVYLEFNKKYLAIMGKQGE